MTETTNKKKTMAKLSVWVIILIAIIAGFLMYWHHSELYPSTDDAYIQAHVVNIAPQVSGPVSQIFAENYQHVKKGQKL